MADEDRSVREELCARGQYDGYLLLDDAEAIAWLQAGPRDRLAKLVEEYGLEPDRHTWAITGLLVAPASRRQGAATQLVADVLADLPRRGARRVEAFPRRGQDLQPGDLWTGSEELYLANGFGVVRDAPQWPVLARDLELPD